MRFQCPSISEYLKLGLSKPALWKKNKKFRRSFFFGLIVLAFVFVLTGCQGFMDDYSYKPSMGLPSSSN